MSTAGPAPNSHCPRCGTAFSCGALAADPVTGTPAQPCWCMAYPPVVSPAPGATCWCPACLAAVTNDRAGGASPAQST